MPTVVIDEYIYDKITNVVNDTVQWIRQNSTL